MQTHAPESFDEGGPVVAVLAGGRSSRMGCAKAMVPLCGRPLISYPLAAARAAGLEAVVIAKRDSTLPALREHVLYEPDTPHHPLCGIVAALRLTGVPVVAVGCDMPFLSSDLLAWLARGGNSQLSEQGSVPAALVAQHHGRMQPLPALYRPAGMGVLQDALAAQRSLRATLSDLKPIVLGEQELRRFGSAERLCFSVNDARDLASAARWMVG